MSRSTKYTKIMENGYENIRKIEWEVGDWIHLTQDRYWWQALVNMVMNLWVP
jgi:hypothetical protein